LSGSGGRTSIRSSKPCRYGIDCDFARTGDLSVATAGWQLDGLAESAEQARRLGADVTLLDAGQVRAEVLVTAAINFTITG